MSFTEEFKSMPEVLVGKKVLIVETGPGGRENKYLRAIKTATASRVTIENYLDQFYHDGRVVGKSSSKYLRDKANWGNTTSIKLLTGEEYLRIKSTWTDSRLKVDKIKFITENIGKVDNNDTLLKIQNLIVNYLTVNNPNGKASM